MIAIKKLVFSLHFSFSFHFHATVQWSRCYLLTNWPGKSNIDTLKKSTSIDTNAVVYCILNNFAEKLHCAVLLKSCEALRCSRLSAFKRLLRKMQFLLRTDSQ